MLNVSPASGPPVGPSVRIHYDGQDKKTDTGRKTSVRFFGTEKRSIQPPPPLQPSDPVGARYYVRDRDLGQTFVVRDQPFRLEALTLRIGPTRDAVGRKIDDVGGASGAAVSLQLLAVRGNPNIHHLHFSDDYITGETYTQLRVVRGGHLPQDLQPQQYLRWALTGDDAVVLEVGNKYAFLVMFDEPAPRRELALANNYSGRHFEGHGIRREGSIDKPYDHPEQVFNAIFGDDRDDQSASSLPLDWATRLQQQPGTWGRPDVDTHRVLRFYLEGTIVSS
jgi:hypothetical protein